MSSEARLRDDLYGMEYREEDERRVPAEERKTYDIKSFWQRHHEIVNLASQGFKQTEIAEILHLHPQTVSNTLNSQLGKEKVSELREILDGDTKKRLAQIAILTERALETYYEIYENKDGQATLKDRKEVSMHIINDLSGLKVPTRIQANVRATILTVDEIAEFKARGLAAAREAGLVVDIEPEPESLPKPDQSLIQNE